MVEADDIDRLPDEMLVEIISQLPGTKQRAATSMLSRRWRHLWTFDSSLDFDEADFLRPISLYRYSHYITEFLSRIQRCPHAFAPHRRLSVIFSKTSPAPEQVDRWMSFAASRSLHELCFRRVDFPFPSLLSASLRVLALDSCCLYDMAPLLASGFPFLHTLVLRDVRMLDAQTQNLLGACPALEHLQIHSTLFPSIRISSAANPRLTNIDIVSKYWPRKGSRLTIEVASLRFLVVSGFDMVNLHLGNSPLLREVGLFPHKNVEDDGDSTGVLLAVERAEIEILSAGGELFQYLHGHNFAKLKVLCAIDLLSNYSYYHLISFIMRCPSLHTVYIECNQMLKERIFDETIKHRTLNCSSIKSITFLQFTTQNDDMSLLKFFLAVVPSLQHVDVAFKHDFKYVSDDFIKKVSQFPTASPCLNIVTSTCQPDLLGSHPLLNQKSCFDVWSQRQ